MALIKCSECGKDISDKAKVCPSCGNPINKSSIKINKKVIVLVSIVVAVVILLAIILSKIVSNSRLPGGFYWGESEEKIEGNFDVTRYKNYFTINYEDNGYDAPVVFGNEIIFAEYEFDDDGLCRLEYMFTNEVSMNYSDYDDMLEDADDLADEIRKNLDRRYGDISTYEKATTYGAEYFVWEGEEETATLRIVSSDDYKVYHVTVYLEFEKN